MLALLPGLTLLGLWACLLQWKPDWGGRRAFLRAALLTGTYTVLATEVLSLFSAITQVGLALAWGLPATALWGLDLWKWKKAGFPRSGVCLPDQWFERLMLLVVCLVMTLAAVIAWFAPPSTWDSLNYHMPRVAQWAQARAVRPFATGIEVQNNMPPGAEEAILNLYVLAGSDRVANFVDWFAFVGSLIGVSLIAGQLGGSRSAQMLSSVLAATLPSALAQASSTMPDLAAGFWLVIAVSEVLGFRQQGFRLGNAAFAGLAAGMVLVTKPAEAPFLVPFGLWGGWMVLRRPGLRCALGSAAVAVACVLALNGWSLLRTQEIYGSVLAPERVATHANELRTPSGIASVLLRNIALNLGTPSPHLNRAVYLAVVTIHDWIGVDPNDPRTTSVGVFRVRAPSVHEDLAANPLHLAVGMLILAGLLWRRPAGVQTLLAYVAAVAGGLVLFSWAFKWQIFGNRFQLPMFIIFCPITAIGLGRLLPARAVWASALVFALACWPWLTGISSRPLIRRADSFVGSVLAQSRQTLLFANALYLKDALESVGGLIRDSRCSTVGLALSGSAPEYLIWSVLGAPRSDLRVEWIVAGTPSARFADPDFAPCAVVCDESCPADWTTIRGLPLSYKRAGYRLFLHAAP
jgi:hypothetical protein